MKYIEKIISIRTAFIAMLFGGASYVTGVMGFRIYLPGNISSTDPREIFNVMGAALTGPVGGTIIALFSTLSSPFNDMRGFVFLTHFLSAVWIGITYKKLLYGRFNNSAFPLAWLFLVTIYYAISVISINFSLITFLPAMYIKVAGINSSPGPVSIFYIKSYLPEYIFTAVITTLIIIALPAKYRKPLWGTPQKVLHVANKDYSAKVKFLRFIMNNFLSIRLSLWFIILFTVPLIYLSVSIRNYFFDFIINSEGRHQYEMVKNISEMLDNVPEPMYLKVLNEIRMNNPSKIIILDKELTPIYDVKPDFNTSLMLKNSGEINKFELLKKGSGFYVDNKLLLAVGYTRLKDGMYLLSISNSQNSSLEITRLVFYLMRNIGLALATIAIIAGLIIWFIVGIPINKLAKVADEIGKHNFDVDIDDTEMSDEVSVLAKSINKMKDNIRLAERSLRESEKRYRNLFENAPIGIYRTTPDGRIVAANPALLNMLGGTSMEQLSNRNLEQKMEYISYTRTKFKERLEKDGVITGLEERWLVEGNRTIFVRENAQLTRDRHGNALYYEGTVEDITEKKIALEELIIAKEKAENANKSKDLFLANMSHELRTPLIGILGYSDLLAETLKEKDSIEMANGIRRSGNRLLNTLNLLLDLTRIESDKFEVSISDCNIAGELDFVYSMFKGAAIEKKLDLKIILESKEIVANTDPSLVTIILENLVNNAIKFTGRGSIIITAGKAGADKVFIKVKDSGIGIDRKNFDKIFKEFSQVSEGINREFQGTGLGLAISKRYAEILNGSILVDSVMGEGSEFTLILPAGKSKA